MERKSSYKAAAVLGTYAIAVTAAIIYMAFSTVPARTEAFGIASTDGMAMAGERYVCFETQPGIYGNRGNFCVPHSNNISSVGRQHLTNCLGNVSSYNSTINCSAINLTFSTNNAAPTGSEATCPNLAATNGFNSTVGTVTTTSYNLTVNGVKWTATGSVTICSECLQFYNGTLFASSNFTCVPMLSGDNASLSHSVFINGT